MSNNNPPFAIGERIVSVANGYKLQIGQEVIVTRIYKPCCVWIVEWGETYDLPQVKLKCNTHGTIHYLNTGDALGAQSVCFRPIQPLYEDIREELAKQVVIGDSADQPVREIVNN